MIDFGVPTAGVTGNEFSESFFFLSIVDRFLKTYNVESLIAEPQEVRQYL